MNASQKSDGPVTNLVSEVGVDADELATVDGGDTLHVDGSLALGVAFAVAARTVDFAVIVGICRGVVSIGFQQHAAGFVGYTYKS
jgi:hypothetical protein